MKVLLTGGAGFIGAHCAKALHARGDQVTVFDDFNDFVYSGDLKRQRGAALIPADVTVIEGSIMDEAALDHAFSRDQINVVVHLAAHANPARSVNYPYEYTLNNTVGTINVLRAMTKHDCGHMIFAGSSSVYNDEHTPFREDAYPLRPKSAYGASKAAAELYCSMWQRLYGVDITVLRFFSVYGPWGRPDMAPMIFADHIMKGQSIVVSSDRQRDFTYIDDTVNGVLLALDRKFGFDIINIGHGQPVALGEFVSALETAAGQKVEHIERPAPAGEMRVTYADIAKAKKVLGYEPQVSLAEGAKRLMAWMKKQS